MNSIRRSCQSALRTSIFPAAIANGSRRAFSGSSACYRGTLPQFLEPSTPELSAALSRLNSKVLLLEHLTPEQKKLVYKKDNRARLEAEAIEITLGDVTLPLEHVDRLKDVPTRRHLVNDVINASASSNDWENVVRMMEGFENAGIPMQMNWKLKTVRKINEAGLQHLVLKALQRADKTGLRLREKSVVLAVYQGLHDKAAQAEWNEPETKKALGFAEQVVEMLENEQHLGKAPVSAGDLRTSPFVIATPLELAAMLSKKHGKEKDVDGKVNKYARRFMSATKHDSNDLNATIQRIHAAPSEAPHKSGSQNNQFMADLKKDIRSLVPVWNALKTANQVLGSEMPMAAQARHLEKTILSTIDQGIAKLEAVVKGGFENSITNVKAAVDSCRKL